MKNFTSILMMCFLMISTSGFSQAGMLDSSFSGDGKVRTPFENEAEAFAIATQPDGRIIAAGYADSGFNEDIALVRYQRNGKPDSSFGVNGMVITGFVNSTT